jgi:succinate-semialdehyde dehydrogenase/glutarate-semialdehyde dehydrogenase
VLRSVSASNTSWGNTALEERAALLRELARLMRGHTDDLASLITLEMGKLIGEARAEIEKCAWVCEYYADQAADFLADELIGSDAGSSFVAHQPLGTVLAVMPWNFPFWQVFRFAAPALAAGNTAVLKHASNVPKCAMSIERLFHDAGFPEHVFRTLMIPSSRVAKVITGPHVQAVTLTGSESAGRQVAAGAGASLKKSLLELGGSDALVVLEDADLEAAVETAVVSRFLNAGQSCIAAKRIILVEGIADAFVERFRAGVEALQPGDPMRADTTLAPMARQDLRDELHRQVSESVRRGAHPVCGCQPVDGAGWFYPASILDRVRPGMPAYSEEVFGPVAAIIRVSNEDEALQVANDTRYGLGGSVWTRDAERGERFARRMKSGAVFVNGLVKSDPRLPFGGIKASGYGRELSRIGMHEFVNAKTVWIK